MSNVRAGAAAMIVGAILTMLVFGFHPSHVVETPVAGPFTLSQLVHGTALVAVPLMAFGWWQLGDWLGQEKAGPRLAVVLAFLAAATTVNAAVISNFVTPTAARISAAAHTAPHAAPAAHKTPTPHQAGHRPLPPLVSLSVAMNRGFAQVHVTFLSLALLLFGFALRSRSALLGWTGVAVGAGPLLWQFSGQFSPSTHSMPLIVFPQAVWMIAVAAVMLRGEAGSSAKT